MSYQISEQLISYNRSHKTLNPQGFVIHSTDDIGATAQNEHDYFNSGDRQASAHYFADWGNIIRTIPENEQAWHAGPTANSKFLSVEICEPTNDSTKFQEVWNKTVWLVADACVRYGWNTNDNVFSHRGISAMYKETDHQDPIEFLASYGKTWDQLLSSIDNEIQNIKGNQSANKEETDVLDVAVLLNTKEDYWAGADVAAKNSNCAVFVRGSDKSIPSDAMSAKKLIVVGGATTGHPNEVLVSRKTKYDTAAAVGKYLG
jgi:N-acetylmuramoyl-L-alanine amidase